MPRVASISICSESGNNASSRACCRSVSSPAPVWGAAGFFRRGLLVFAAGGGGVLLAGAIADSERVIGEPADMERVHPRHGVGKLLRRGGLEAGEPVHRGRPRPPSRQCWERAVSQVLNTALERPSTISSSLEGPVFLRTGVRSMITVTYLSPNRV